MDFLDLSYKITYTNVQYIQDYNFYRHEIKRLNEIIKPKIRNINQTNEIIIIIKKSIKDKVNEEMIKTYYTNNIEELKNISIILKHIITTKQTSI